MADWKNIILKTGVDKLLDIVEKKGAIDMADAVELLATPPETVEVWVKALAREGLIKTDYDSLGNIIIKPASGKIKDKSAKIKALKKDIAQSIKDVEKSAVMKEKSIAVTRGDIEKFEKIIEKDLSKIKNMEKEIEAFSKEKDRFMSRVHEIEIEGQKLVKESEKIKSDEIAISEWYGMFSEKLDAKLKLIKKTEKELDEILEAKERLRNDIKVMRTISKILKSSQDTKLAGKIDDLEKKTKFLKEEHKKLNTKYGVMKKLVESLFR